MLRMRFGRSLAVFGLAGATALAVAPMMMEPAGATLTGIKCGTLTGNITTSVKAKNCTGNTGGASKAISSTALASGSGTITWVNGKKTGVQFTEKGESKDPGETRDCATGTTEYEIKGTVTSDTTGSTHVGAVFTAEVCVNNATGAISLEPGTKAVIKP